MVIEAGEPEVFGGQAAQTHHGIISRARASFDILEQLTNCLFVPHFRRAAFSADHRKADGIYSDSRLRRRPCGNSIDTVTAAVSGFADAGETGYGEVSMKTPFGTVICLAILCVLTGGSLAPALAQNSSSVLAGKVTDPNGAPLPGVMVTASSTPTGFVRSTVTGERGAYRLSGLPPGVFTIAFELAGFAPLAHRSLTLAIGADATLNVQLQVGSIREAVTVSAGHPLIETSQKSVTTTITPIVIDALPVVGRKFVNLAALAPGVTLDYAGVTSTTDSIAFGGVSENYKSLWFEGIDIGDESTGGGTNLSDASRLTIPQEAVQEFQVMASQYSVEFGRSATGVINVLGKSGTNEWRGRGYYFLKDDAFDKPNAFATGKTPYRQQMFGASLGGPIRKDRAHVFATYDGQVQHNVVTYKIPDFVLPLLPDFDKRTEAPQPSSSHNAYGKLTWTLSPTEYLSVTALGGHSRQELAGTGGSIAADAGYTNLSKDIYLAAALTSAFNNHWTHILRLAWSDVVTDRPTSGPTGPTVTFPSFTFGERSNYPQSRFQKNAIVMSTTEYHRESARFGTHDVKFGASANVTQSNYSEERGFNGAYVFLQDKLPVAGVPSTYPATFSIRTGNGAIENRDVNVFAFFVEDQAIVRPGLTVTAGIRYDPQFWRGELAGAPIPTDIPITQFWARFVAGDLKGTNYLAVPADHKTFGPRVGVAWDPMDDGKTVVRAGWGIFNAFITTRFPVGSIGTYPDVLSSAFGNDVRVTGIPNLSFPNLMPLSALSKSGSTSVSVPVPESLARFPSTQQYTIGVERQIAGATTLSLNYAKIRGSHFQRTYNVNARRADGTYPVLASGIILNVFAWDASTRTDQVLMHLSRRLSGRLAFDASYTYTRAFGMDTPVDANDPNNRVNWGPTINDLRHRVVGSLVYRLPFGVQLGALVTATSAPPYNVITGTDDNKDRNINDRPLANGAMLGPNSGRGDRYFDADVRLSKSLTAGRKRLDLIVETFNLFNTRNYGGYNGNRLAVTFGQPTVALTPFQAQLGLRFDF